MPWKKQFKTNEEYNAWYRDYRAKNRKKMRLYNKQYNSNWRKDNGYHNENKWRKNNPEKVEAQKEVHRTLRKGIILKRACLMCNLTRTVAHHPNYKKPLQVVWVCKPHHHQIHYGK